MEVNRKMYHMSSPGCSSAENTSAATSTALFCVTGRTHFYLSNNCHYFETRLNVKRFDESLNKFKPHFSWLWVNIDSPGVILFENKLFRIGGADFRNGAFDRVGESNTLIFYL